MKKMDQFFIQIGALRFNKRAHLFVKKAIGQSRRGMESPLIGRSF